eukprot:GHVQ01036113.1.p1 GENE.GHVQ01036113.1~~GHVQ01036113.1.p1  ORF type:complete len:671 (+),score=37.55 GHVQ01036113.1:773-2785(+)
MHNGSRWIGHLFGLVSVTEWAVQAHKLFHIFPVPCNCIVRNVTKEFSAAVDRLPESFPDLSLPEYSECAPKLYNRDLISACDSFEVPDTNVTKVEAEVSGDKTETKKRYKADSIVYKWMIFFDIWGTDIVHQMTLGGKAKRTVSIRLSTIKDMKEKGDDIQGEATVIIGVGGGGGKGAARGKEDFSKREDVFESHIGPTPPQEWTQQSAVADWSQRVKNEATPVRLEHVPMTKYMKTEARKVAYVAARAFYGLTVGKPTPPVQTSAKYSSNNKKKFNLPQLIATAKSFGHYGDIGSKQLCPDGTQVWFGFGWKFNMWGIRGSMSDYGMSKCPTGSGGCSLEAKHDYVYGDKAFYWALCHPKETRLPLVIQVVPPMSTENVTTTSCPRGMRIGFGFGVSTEYCDSKLILEAKDDKAKEALYKDNIQCRLGSIIRSRHNNRNQDDHIHPDWECYDCRMPQYQNMDRNAKITPCTIGEPSCTVTATLTAQTTYMYLACFDHTAKGLDRLHIAFDSSHSYMYHQEREAGNKKPKVEVNVECYPLPLPEHTINKSPIPHVILAGWSLELHPNADNWSLKRQAAIYNPRYERDYDSWRIAERHYNKDKQLWMHFFDREAYTSRPGHLFAFAVCLKPDAEDGDFLYETRNRFWRTFADTFEWTAPKNGQTEAHVGSK